MSTEHKGRCGHKKHTIWRSNGIVHDRVKWRRPVATLSLIIFFLMIKERKKKMKRCP